MPEQSDLREGKAAASRYRGFLKWVRLLAALAGLIFLGVVVGEHWDRAGNLPMPGGTQLTLAFLLAFTGLLVAGRGWTALFANAPNSTVLQAFYESQLAKYIPGGIWQPVSQVALTTQAEVPIARAALAFPVHSLTQVASAATIGAGVAFYSSGESPWIPVISLVGLGGVGLLHRSWMGRVLHCLRRWINTVPTTRTLPAQSAILRSYGWGLLAAALGGAAFSVLVSGSFTGDFPLPVLAFCFAWWLGFLALPFPSGLGVREGVLILLLPQDSATVVAASVGLRLVSIVGEVGLIGFYVIRSRHRSGIERS